MNEAVAFDAALNAQLLARRPTVAQCAAHDYDPLRAFFARCADDPTLSHLTLLSFTDDYAEEITRRPATRGYYAALWLAEAIIGYGFLRWAAGFPHPSLGIVLQADVRGKGYASVLMAHLHDAARVWGATHVRLRTRKDNTAARTLYDRLGYVFDGTEDRGEVVGLKLLIPVPAPWLCVCSTWNQGERYCYVCGRKDAKVQPVDA